jgi:hypothetical protein
MHLQVVAPADDLSLGLCTAILALVEPASDLDAQIPVTALQLPRLYTFYASAVPKMNQKL